MKRNGFLEVTITKTIESCVHFNKIDVILEQGHASFKTEFIKIFIIEIIESNINYVFNYKCFLRD